VTTSYGSSTRPRLGEVANGDAVVVRPFGAGSLFAVIDGLGHGPAAAKAASAAVTLLESPALGGTPESIVFELDRALKGTRGAAGLVGTVAGAVVSCCAVGNVDLRSHGVRLPVMLTPGIIGAGLRRATTFGGQLPEGSRLVVFSDGISSRFTVADTIHLPPQVASRALLEAHGRATDDATVLVLEMRCEV
jgi:negative regulator of sigma-B (phosphoserine phosphatase)